MAEEPSEKEERLSKQEERLTHAHERRKEAANMPTKRTTGGGNFGKAIGGIGEFFGEHKMIVLAVVGFGIVFYVIMKGRQTSSTTTANQQGSLAGNQTSGTATALDSLQTQLNNLAATVSGIPAGATGATGPTGPAGPSGGGGGGGIIPSTGWHAPLIAQGAWPSNFQWQFGQKVGFNGTTYTVGPGSGGVIWGVPNFKGTLAQWNQVPIGTGPGQKVAVYGTNPADYVPPTLNPQADHSPLYNFMSLSPSAVPGTDLSHSGVAFGPKQGGRPIGHPYAQTR